MTTYGPLPIQDNISDLLDRVNTHFVFDEEFARYITLDDYSKIRDFFLSLDQVTVGSLSKLTPGSGFRLDKKQYKLPRTCTVLCTQQEYIALIEAKSKLPDGNKNKKNNISGGFKILKDALRIDCPAQLRLYVNAGSLENTSEDLDRFWREIFVTKWVKAEEVTPLIKGPVYLKKGRQIFHLYALKARFDLENFFKTTEFKALIPSQINNMIFMLLKGVKALHESGYAHQDLKANNILIYPDGTLKVNDFGNTFRITDSLLSFCIADHLHASPQILSHYARNEYKGTSIQSYFHGMDNRSSFSYQMYLKYTKEFFGEYLLLKNIINKPRLENDIWALGILIFRMLNIGRFPTLDDLPSIQKNPLLEGLLQISFFNRIKINTAIEIFNNITSEKQIEIVHQPQLSEMDIANLTIEPKPILNAMQLVTKESSNPPIKKYIRPLSKPRKPPVPKFKPKS